MVYYVGELDVDGFRCDVGDGVPLDFWNEGRRRMQAIKPDSMYRERYECSRRPIRRTVPPSYSASEGNIAELRRAVEKNSRYRAELLIFHR